MPPEDQDDQQGTGTDAPDAIDDAIAATAPSPSPAAQSVMDSPEYKALAKQNRQLARDAGRSKAAEEAARADAAATRAAAEAQQQAAMEAQIAAILGDEGVEEWNAISELAAVDQVEAAKRLAALMQKGGAQTPAPEAQAAAAATTPAAAGGNAMAQPPRGVDADAPLQTTSGDEMSQLIGGLETTWDEGVKRNQDPATRNRMTMRDRAAALIAYVGASYLKAGARPRTDR